MSYLLLPLPQTNNLNTQGKGKLSLFILVLETQSESGILKQNTFLFLDLKCIPLREELFHFDANCAKINML